MQYVHNNSGVVNLQATLSAASAPRSPTYQPHHPICCHTDLRLEEDNSFSCEHVTVPPDDPRTHSIIDHTIAMLLIELASRL